MEPYQSDKKIGYCNKLYMQLPPETRVGTECNTSGKEAMHAYYICSGTRTSVSKLLGPHLQDCLSCCALLHQLHLFEQSLLNEQKRQLPVHKYSLPEWFAWGSHSFVKFCKPKFSKRPFFFKKKVFTPNCTALPTSRLTRLCNRVHFSSLQNVCIVPGVSVFERNNTFVGIYMCTHIFSCGPVIVLDQIDFWNPKWLVFNMNLT